jgi:small-conductance mechanosensitive channel
MTQAAPWVRRATRLAAATFAVALCTQVAAQPRSVERPLAAQSEAAGDTAEAAEPASLRVFNREVVVFRAPFLGTQPWERVKLAQLRVSELLARGGPGAVAVEDLAQGSMVTLDGTHAFVVTPGDLAGTLEETPHVVAQRSAAVLRQVVSETREARDLRQMLYAAGEAGVATLLYSFLLWALVRVRRLIARKLVAIATRQSKRLHVGGLALFSSDSAATLLGRTVSVTLLGVGLLLSFQWAAFVFGRFPFTRPWGEKLHLFFIDLLLGLLRGIVAALPGLMVALLIFWLARIVVRAVNSFFTALLARRLGGGWLDADTARPTRRLLVLGIWIFAVVIAYPYLPGAQTEAFKGISVLVGLMVSLGGSSLVAQAASGFILMYTRTFRTGEYVRIGEHQGTIAELGTFTTRLHTGLGEEVVLPNAFVIAAATRNYSRVVQGEGFILHATVTIGYDTPWRQVEAMLLEAANRTEGLVATASYPGVFQTALSDFYVEYRLVTQATPADPSARAGVLSALNSNIQDVFSTHGVQIMSPHYYMDPAAEKVVPKARWYAAPAKPPSGS